MKGDKQLMGKSKRNKTTVGCFYPEDLFVSFPFCIHLFKVSLQKIHPPIYSPPPPIPLSTMKKEKKKKRASPPTWLDGIGVGICK